MAFQNISIKQPVPTSNPATPNVKVADAPLIRKIAPITEYNSETGTVEVSKNSPWGVRSEEETQEQTQEATKTDEKAKPKLDEKHEQWKAAQKAKREAREETKLAKQVKQQMLAKDYLRKGDAVGAAKALGMSPAEFAMYAQNAMLSIPTKEEEMTPEQKKEKEWEDYRKERKAFEEEQRQWRANKDYQDFVSKNFDPLLTDKDKFEFCNRADLNQLKQSAYEYMNQHYQETTVYGSDGKIVQQGEILNAADVFETIEQNLEQTFMQSLENAKGIKKLAKFFNPQTQEQQTEDQETQQQPAKVQISKFGNKFDQMNEPTLANKQPRDLDSRFPVKHEIEEEETPEEEQPTTNINSVVPRLGSKKSNVPFALLSKEERMARIRAGQ